MDGAGALFVAARNDIRPPAPDGTITTVLGGGDQAPGNTDDPLRAQVYEVRDIAVGPDGALYALGSMSPVVYRVDPDGRLGVAAGVPGEGGFSGDGGLADAAELNTPTGLAVHGDDLYILDTFNARVRRVDADGDITTVAGTGEPRDLGNGVPAVEAGLAEPTAIAAGPDGSLYLTGPDTEGVRRWTRRGPSTPWSARRP